MLTYLGSSNKITQPRATGHNRVTRPTRRDENRVQVISYVQKITHPADLVPSSKDTYIKFDIGPRRNTSPLDLFDATLGAS